MHPKTNDLSDCALPEVKARPSPLPQHSMDTKATGSWPFINLQQKPLTT